jgi:predicted metal-binding protein
MPKQTIRNKKAIEHKHAGFESYHGTIIFLNIGSCSMRICQRPRLL